MADARVLHRRAGGSAKVGALSHFEYRVWTQYLLSADDYGVMPAYAASLQADNKLLRKLPTVEVQAALDVVMASTLIATFAHQGELFCWSYDWQDWQAIRYPRATVHPMPPPDEFTKATKATQELFAKHREYSRKDYGSISGISRNVSGTSRSLTRARERETLTLTQTLTPTPEGGVGETVAPFERFWARYPRKVARQAALEEWQRARLDASVAVVLAGLERAIATRQWQEAMRTDAEMRLIPHARTWLHQRRWQDESSGPQAPPARKPRVTEDVEALCSAAGIPRSAVYDFFVSATIDVRSNGVITLVITDEVDRAYVARCYSDQLEQAAVARGAHKLVITDQRAS